MNCINSVNIDSIKYIINPYVFYQQCQHIVFDGMVEKPSVSAFQNFNWIENWLNI